MDDRKDILNADVPPQEIPYDEKFDVEKGSASDGPDAQVHALTDDQHLRDVEEMEQRIQDGTATKDDYRINSNEEVARKVSFHLTHYCPPHPSDVSLSDD